MAEIFLARGVSTTGVERYCVLKRILRNRASDVTFVRMFLDEARLAAQLQHPNVAQVYDIGKLGDSYFFTMEYVHGETIRAIMQRARSLRRDLPIGSVLSIVAGAAGGLHHAHDRIGIDGRPLNIVHRDVSPSNLMVSYEGNVKVVDFGVAKASDRAIETRSGTVKGKISYLSPEQARGSSSIDRRSDMFSLGIVMWEMLTTERLYKRSSDFENMTAIVTEETPPPSSRNSSIPPELDAITLKLLAKSPADRFQTAGELIEALEDFASRHATMISSSALARFLRDMFGQRPEPWVELDTQEVPEGVTVTSEPIPIELAIPVNADVDLKLGNVPKLDLEQPLAQVDDELMMPTPLIGVDVEMLPTRPHSKVDPMMTTLSDVAPPPPQPRMPLAGHTIAGIGGSGPLARIPGSGPQVRIESTGSGLAYPRAVSTDRLPDDVDDPPSKGVGWQLVAIIMIAAIVGSLTMWFVMRGRGGDKSIDAAVAVVQPPPPVMIDAAEPVVMPPVMIDAAEVAEPPPPDAAELAVIEIDAGAPVGKPVEKPVEKIEKPVEKKDPPKPKKSVIEAAWDAGNHRAVVSQCSKSFPGAGDDVRCVVSACKVNLPTKARTFFAKLSSTSKARKAAVATACWNANTEIDLDPKPKPPPEKPPEKKDDKKCDTDPMSCQH